MIDIQRVAAATRLELIRFARDPNTWIGGLLALALLGFEAWQYAHALPPRRHDSALFGYSYVTFAVIALHTGIARDRAFRFDTFVASNLLLPRELFGARIAAYLIELAAIWMLLTLTLLVLAFGDVGYAIWRPAIFTLIWIMALPAVLLTEVSMNTRYPAAIVFLLFGVAMTVIHKYGDAAASLHFFALDRGYNAHALVSLGLRAVIAIVISVSLYPLFFRRIGARSEVLHV